MKAKLTFLLATAALLAAWLGKFAQTTSWPDGY
jgi:hypothetical protein